MASQSDVARPSLPTPAGCAPFDPKPLAQESIPPDATGYDDGVCPPELESAPDEKSAAQWGTIHPSLLLLSLIVPLCAVLLWTFSDELRDLKIAVSGLESGLAHLEENVVENRARIKTLFDSEARTKSQLQDLGQAIAADGVARRDYAQGGAGGRIDISMTSGTYSARRTLGLWATTEYAHEPGLLLQPGAAVGNCWCFSGSSGQIAVSFDRYITPTAFSLDYPVKQASQFFLLGWS